jgi:hypothetical protein
MLICNKPHIQKPYKATLEGLLKFTPEAKSKGFDRDLVIRAMEDIAVAITMLIRANSLGPAEKIEWSARHLFGVKVFQPYMDKAFENARIEDEFSESEESEDEK